LETERVRCVVISISSINNHIADLTTLSIGLPPYSSTLESAPLPRERNHQPNWSLARFDEYRMPADPSGVFLEYHEPDIVSILTLLSFFVFLAVSEWSSDKIFRAGLIGQVIVGVVYGVPIANILALSGQEAFLALGYIGLILIIFEGAVYLSSCYLPSGTWLTRHSTMTGGLSIRLDLLRQNLVLSIIAALLGVLTPIALSFALLYAGFGHGTLLSCSSLLSALPAAVPTRMLS
jgi:hypothetical protein